MNPPPLRGPPPGSAAPETSPHDGKWLLESSTRTWIEYQLVCDPHGPPPTANRGGAPRLPPAVADRAQMHFCVSKNSKPPVLGLSFERTKIQDDVS